MIVLVESHVRERAPRQAPVQVPSVGARWGQQAEFGFEDAPDTGGLTGIRQVDKSANPSRVQLWNLSPVWRRYDVAEVPSSQNPGTTQQARVTREMLIPVGTSVQKYVGGGIGYVEDPRGYAFELRTIHTFVHISVPSPVPDVEVVASGIEGAWPDYPEEAYPPGRFAPVAPLPGPWTR